MLLDILIVSLLYSSSIDAIPHSQADEAVAITITAPPAAPSNACFLIDPNFAGFAFEERSFYYYFGILTVSYH